MTKAELIEEVRSLLNEAQLSTVEKPWHYTDVEFIPQIRSALRFLRTRGVATTGVMDKDGTFSTEPSTEVEGALIALYVAEKLISGDLTQKLADGELGVIFKAGSDLIDTKVAAQSFSKAASGMADQFQTLLTIALSNADGGLNSVFGGTETYILEP